MTVIWRTAPAVAGGNPAGRRAVRVLLPSRIMTEADVVRSERVALRALQAMDASYQQEMRERFQSRTDGQGDLNAWLAEELQRTTEVRPTRDSRVFW